MQATQIVGSRPEVLKLAGIKTASVSGAVGPTWKEIAWASVDLNTLGAGLSNGKIYLATPGLYDVSAQIYPAPPAAGSEISMYFGLFDHGATGTGDTLLRVSNQYFPGGMHPSVSLHVALNVSAASYYSFRWYFLDGAAVSDTLQLQQSAIYCGASVLLVRKS